MARLRTWRRGEAGYNLVILMVAITVMNILIAATLPAWSQAIQREKEEELIFRGFQYAEAIRVFQIRFGRLPVRLDELIKTEPRSIRQLWKDPMTADGKWGILFQGQPQVPLKGGDGNGKEEVAVGPIIGVYSKSHKNCILLFDGREHYDEWRFTVDRLTNRVQSGGAAVPTNAPGHAKLSIRWEGRPMPLLLPQQGQMPQGMNTGLTPSAGSSGNSGSTRKPQ
jgi:type II secretory pathway pseudopilin PulG